VKFVSWLVVAAVLAAVAWAVAGQLDAPSWLKASVAGLAAASAGIGTLLERREGDAATRRARERTLHENLRFWELPRGRLYRLSEIERRGLGIDSRAIEFVGSGLDDSYVPRPEDEAVRRAVRDQAFTLVVGGSKVGKTRSAYEAAMAVCPDHNLVVPEAARSLVEILTVDPRLELGKALVWLDDLDGYFERGGGLTLNVLAALRSRDPPVRILATIATSEFDRYMAGRAVSRPAQLVLAHAATIYLQPCSDIDTVSDALGPISERFARNVGRYGLGATLVAGPDLVRRFERADDPVGVAIVRAAADCRRAGISSPVPEPVLEQLFPSYVGLDQHLGAQAFRAGLDWALFEIHTATALLERRSQEPPAYMASDYLVEHIEAEGKWVNDAVWQHGLSLDGIDSLLSVGLSAYAHDRLEVAAAAFEAASTAGSAEAAYNLAAVLGDQEGLDESAAVRDELDVQAFVSEESGTTSSSTTETFFHTRARMVDASELSNDPEGSLAAPLVWEVDPGVTAIRAFGELDIYTAPHLKQALLDVISQGTRHVIVDFTEVTFIESTTLGVLVGATKRLRSVDGRLVLIARDRNIIKIFEIVGLDSVIPILPTLDRARRFFEPPPQEPG
jgi:anti-anti-sigma factor